MAIPISHTQADLSFKFELISHTALIAKTNICVHKAVLLAQFAMMTPFDSQEELSFEDPKILKYFILLKSSHGTLTGG